MTGETGGSIIIGTAGHVDHGKTQLVKALTGIETDRLAEEKKRGITIDLGFAWLDLPGGARAGIVDVPGHERFIKNMLAGAGGVSLALLVVAADDGVMPQTREHLTILDTLGISDGVIVITKADLAEAEWIEFVKEDIQAAAQGTFLARAPIVAVSSHTGEGIEALRALLVQKVAAAQGGNTTRPFRVPVDRVFSVEGFGTVITGTLIEGALSEGDEVEIYPLRRKSRVRNLQVHARDVETAYAGQRVAVNLAGIRREEIARGDTLAAPGSMQDTLRLDVKLKNGKDSGRTVKNGSRLHFYHGAREALPRVTLFGKDTLAPGEEAYAQLRFDEDMAAKRGDHFIVRFYSPIETVGGGIILDASPKRHRRSDETVIAQLGAREHGTATDTVLAAIADASPAFTPTQDIQKKLSMDAETFKAALEALLADGSAVRLSAKVVLSAEYREALFARLSKLLRDFHAQNPLKAGMRRDVLRGQLLPGREMSLSDRVLSLFEDDGRIISADQKVRLSGFQITYTQAEKALSEKMLAAFRAAPYAPPSPEELFAKMPKDVAMAKRVFEALVDEGLLLMATAQMYFLAEAVQDAFGGLSQVATQNGQITLAEFRDLTGTSRKFALSMLEYFDRQGKTRMVGDARVLVKKGPGVVG